jgi:hypothetical protein
METTLGEQILLLSLDDTTGAPQLQVQSEYMISAACLLELAIAGRIRLEDDRLVVQDGTPLGIPALDEALTQLSAQDKHDNAQTWIYELRKGAAARARQGLLDKGIIREERTRVLGLFPRTRYPEADSSAEDALRQQLTAVVLEGQAPETRIAALVVLLHAGGLHRLAFPDADQQAVKDRMAKLMAGHWAEPVMKQLVDSVLVALTTFTTMTAVNLAINSST